jgi:AcrR family transcriptional regulator
MNAALLTAPPKTDSRRLVLDQAARLFRERGYAETSLRDIAVACGMKPASLYYHFASKEEIVTAVLDTGVLTVSDEVRRGVAALGAEAPAADRLRAAIGAHLRALLELDDYTGANIRIFGHVPPRVRAATMAPRERYENWWRGLLADAAAEGAIRPGTDLRLLRLLLLGAMNWSVEWHRPRRGDADSVARIADTLAGMVQHGVFTQGTAPLGTVPQARTRRALARKG